MYVSQPNAIQLESIAVVTNTDDPEQKGRFKVKCPDIAGDQELPFWITSYFQYGSFSVPRVNDKVVIYRDYQSLGDESKGASSMRSPNYRWKGEIIVTPEEDKSKYVVNENFKTNYGSRNGYYTRSGHVLFFDDTEGSEDVELKNGKTGAYISFSADGAVIMEDENGNVLRIKDNKIEAVHSQGPKISVEGNSVSIDSGASGTTTVEGGVKSELSSTTEARVSGPTVTLAATVSLNITSNATIVLDAPSVKLGETATLGLLTSSALAPYLAHTHSIPGGGVTGIPVTGLWTAANFTSKTKGE